ncbi:hypothetical protein [Rhizohabitans arisaemae]|uniref:hypothetical protein n=1 Tax=Rhizohabitans arisaemae TaxID=2720610 RepID=UPI0024B05190|nr:hypothetical protein [Rhizohabitans arisaemae]
MFTTETLAFLSIVTEHARENGPAEGTVPHPRPPLLDELLVDAPEPPETDHADS